MNVLATHESVYLDLLMHVRLDFGQLAHFRYAVLMKLGHSEVEAFWAYGADQSHRFHFNESAPLENKFC